MGVSHDSGRADDSRVSQLQAVLDHAPDAFVSMAPDGRIIEWNLQAERMFGWSRAEALGCTVAELIVPPQTRQDHEHGLARYLQTGEARVLNRPIEVQAQTKDGGLIPLELTIAAVGSSGATTFNAFMRDISERRANELALREAEATFRGAFTDASVGMCLATLDGCRWMQVNPALCALLGYSADRLIGMGFDQVTHPDDVEGNVEGARRLRDGEISCYETEKRYLHADGHVIWVSLSVSLLRDAGGDPRCFIAQVLDITARKASDQALITSEERFRLMVENVQDYAILSLDAQGHVATWNAGAQRFKGYEAEEIIGRHFSVFYPPEDVAAGKPERELQVAAAEGRLEDEGWRVTKTGTRFWANVVITALRDADGTLRGYGKITRDLTERRVAEQARHAAHVLFETAFAEAPIGMALVGLEGSWLKVNRALSQIVGWSEAELLARTFQELTHPGDLDADLAHVAALVRGETDSYQMEKRYCHRSGDVIWTRLSVTLVHDAAGAPAHLIAQIEDISERRQHEAEERALRDVAELVAAGAEPAIVFSAITEQVCELLGASAGAVVQFDRTANTGVMVAASASDGADLVGTTFDLQNATATAEVFRSGKPARVDALNLPPEDPLTPTVRRFGLNGTVAAPIHVVGQLWGAVGAAGAEQHIAAGAELRLERFAHLASLAITNLRTLETLEHRAATDPLTGIANHRTFHDRLGSEVERARRYGRDLSVVLFDLDHFKAINDTHGHQTGDRILKEVAQRLAGEAREGELVARIGGEEFAWLLPESDQHGAYAAAERVRRAIETTPFADVGPVTLSAGVCCTTHAHDAQQLMHNADRALYSAKEHGRNNTSVTSAGEHAAGLLALPRGGEVGGFF